VDPRPSPARTSAPVEPVAGLGYLLSQLGAHATARFAEQVAELGLTIAQAGLLRRVGDGPGRSQQAVAAELGALPSKVVALVDELEARGLLERRRNLCDRRHYALHLTERGEQLMTGVVELSQAHERELVAALDPDEYEHLTALLRRIADQQGLAPSAHPVWRFL
jgi:DNA-binding MarR family transcriptional regulator